MKRDSDFRYGERYLLCLTQKVCNVCALHQRASINWRTNPVPAPAVIPVPVAYSNVVAFKTLVSRRRTEYPHGALGSLWPAFGFEIGAVRWSTFGSIRWILLAVPQFAGGREGVRRVSPSKAPKHIPVFRCMSTAVISQGGCCGCRLTMVSKS